MAGFHHKSKMLSSVARRFFMKDSVTWASPSCLPADFRQSVSAWSACSPSVAPVRRSQPVQRSQRIRLPLHQVSIESTSPKKGKKAHSHERFCFLERKWGQIPFVQETRSQRPWGGRSTPLPIFQTRMIQIHDASVCESANRKIAMRKSQAK